MLKLSAPNRKSQVTFGVDAETEKLAKSQSRQNDWMNGLVVNPANPVVPLAFDRDPRKVDFQAIYRDKTRTVPDYILKNIALKNSVVSNIVRHRQNHMSNMGRPRSDRYGWGYVFQVKTGILDQLDDATKKDIHNKIQKLTARWSTCGEQEGLEEADRKTFVTYLIEATWSILVNGRMSTEIVWKYYDNGEKEFHSFRPVDAGTVYRAIPQNQTEHEAIRQDAYRLLYDTLASWKKGYEKKLDFDRFCNDKFTWVQVKDGSPLQVFTDEELKCQNFYPVPDIELDGYPNTPIDTVLSAVTTQFNLTAFNRLFFTSGRGTSGMLIIKSEDLGQTAINSLTHQFNASINSTTNAHRMPVFACGIEEDIEFKPITNGNSWDSSFQYMADANLREIFSAFAMGVDEIQAYSNLSRGTNAQSQAESNNEFKMEAARDTGIRPLIAQMEDYLNSKILPVFDPEMAQIVEIRLVGIDADSADREAAFINTASPIYMTYDDIMERVEKPVLGKEWGGTLPLNPVMMGYLNAHFTIGEIQAHFMGRKDALNDPMKQYRADPYFFQWLAYKQAEAQGGGAPDMGGGPPTEEKPPSELSGSIDEAQSSLSKKEGVEFPPEDKEHLDLHRRTVDHFMRNFLLDVEDTHKVVMDTIKPVLD